MIADRNLCGWCPDTKANLELIETRFQYGVCFVELQCKHCSLLWTAEVSMPTVEETELAKRRPEMGAPGWRLLDIVPAKTADVM